MARRNTTHAKAATARKLDDETAPVAGARRLGSVSGGGGSPGATLALDRVIHEHVRLAIVSALAVNEVLTFNDLKQLLDASDGNLSVHARKLEEAGYVNCRKTFDGRIPRTEFRLTAAGRRALERYLAHMEALIKRVGGE